MTAEKPVARSVTYAVLCLVVLCLAAASAGSEEYRFVRKWGSEGSGNGQFSIPIGVGVDASGNVYVTDYGDNHRVQKFDSSGNYLTQWGSRGTGDGQFVGPAAVAIDASGNVYVADMGNHRIQKFDSDGTFLAKWGSFGSGDGQLYAPNGVALDSSGNVYVTEYGNDRVQKFSANGTFLAKWGSSGTGDGQFNHPRGVAVGSSGNVYVGDWHNHRVQKFDSSGAFLGKWGSYGTDDGQFNEAYGVAVDSSGNVYVSDRLNSRIQKFDANGNFLTKWGSYGLEDGQFGLPCGVAVGPTGSVYVGDAWLHCIHQFEPVVPMLAWVGTSGYETDGVDPDGGDPTIAAPTTFTFKVKYTDPTGNAPLAARCVVQKRAAAGGWTTHARTDMTLESGSVDTGAVYACSMELPGEVLKYRFAFQAADGNPVAGTPSVFQEGKPSVSGAPRLCWSGKAGFETDGVDPGSGPLGTSFRFQVMCVDPGGDVPTQAQVEIRRNGALWRTLDMNPWASGSDSLGRIYQCRTQINRAGAYEYRFAFADASGAATGDPTDWQSAPTIGGASGAMLASVAALPTAAGAQVSFSLTGAANVTATVVNIAGRPIRMIAADKPLDAGVQTLVWDRRAESGLPVPAGLYLIRVTARDADGRQSTALAALALP